MRTRLERALQDLFGDDRPTRLGSGWVSGVLAVLCGMLALGGALCFRFPALLSTQDLRARYPIPALRVLLAVVLIAAFVLALVSAVLRRRKVLAVVAVGLATTATLLGGAWAPLPSSVASPIGLGLDRRRTRPSTSFTAPFTGCPCCGDFTQSTTRARRGTGWPARACISSMPW